MPSRQITLVNYPPSPKQKTLFMELTGFSRFPISSITTRQGCHLAIKAMIEGRAKGLELNNIEFPRQVFAKEWNKDYSVKDWGTSKAISVAELAILNDIAVKAVTPKAAKVKMAKLATFVGVDVALEKLEAKAEQEDQASESFDGVISVRRNGQIK